MASSDKTKWTKKLKMSPTITKTKAEVLVNLTDELTYKNGKKEAKKKSLNKNSTQRRGKRV